MDDSPTPEGLTSQGAAKLARPYLLRQFLSTGGFVSAPPCPDPFVWVWNEDNSLQRYKNE